MSKLPLLELDSKAALARIFNFHNIFSLLIPIYLAWVVKFVADIENYMNAVERVLEYTELDPEEDMKKYPERIENCYERGVINFDNVYLGYYLDSRVIIGMYFEKLTYSILQKILHFN